ncbi:MAG TPA: hypothetical protein VIH87_08130 [Methylocella sp.]
MPDAASRYLRATGRFAWICPCNGKGDAFQHLFTTFQKAENLIALIGDAASRIAIPVAHS